jgi:hypothetical protein
MPNNKSLFNCKFNGKPTPVYTALSQPKSENQAAICERLDNLYAKYEPVLDGNFNKQFPRETNRRYWELYLAHFLSQQFTLELPKKKKNNQGPDFCFQHEGKTIWVEAVAPTPGRGENRVPPLIYDGSAQKPPKEKIILRYQSSLRDKAKEFEDDRNNGIVKHDDIQIIAVSDADLPLFSKNGAWGHPYILNALFPMGDYRIEINRNSGQSVGEGYGYQEERLNANNAIVGYFFQESNELISGVLYHASHMGGLFGDEWENINKNQLYFIHNPFAKHPLPQGLFKCGHEYTADYDGDGGFIINHAPLAH